MTIQLELFSFAQQVLQSQVKPEIQDFACCFPVKAGVIVAAQKKKIERNPFRF
jgi:hypothetical protein